MLENEKARLSLEAKYYNYLDEYLAEEENSEVPVSPATMGIEDPLLSTLLQELAGLQANHLDLLRVVGRQTHEDQHADDRDREHDRRRTEEDVYDRGDDQADQQHSAEKAASSAASSSNCAQGRQHADSHRKTTLLIAFDATLPWQ